MDPSIDTATVLVQIAREIEALAQVKSQAKARVGDEGEEEAEAEA